MAPSTNPKPGPNTRPANTSRKKTVSTPPVPAASGRSPALTAASTPSMASALESIPPLENSANTTATSTGRISTKASGASLVWASPGGGTTSSGQQNMVIPASEASTSTRPVRRERPIARLIRPPPVQPGPRPPVPR